MDADVVQRKEVPVWLTAATVGGMIADVRKALNRARRESDDWRDAAPTWDLLIRELRSSLSPTIRTWHNWLSATHPGTPREYEQLWSATLSWMLRGTPNKGRYEKFLEDGVALGWILGTIGSREEAVLEERLKVSGLASSSGDPAGENEMWAGGGDASAGDTVDVVAEDLAAVADALGGRAPVPEAAHEGGRGSCVATWRATQRRRECTSARGRDFSG